MHSEPREMVMSAGSDAASRSGSGWPLERALFAIAGTVTLLSAALAAAVSPWFLLLTAFVGVNQWLFVLAGTCPMSALLRRAFGLKSPCDSAAGPRTVVR